VNILIAMRWVVQARSSVTGPTISKCIKRAGILNSENEIASHDMEEEDRFLAADEEGDFIRLMNDVVPNFCSPIEYVVERMTYLCATLWGV